MLNRKLLPLLICSTLAACGGSGGGSSAPPSGNDGSPQQPIVPDMPRPTSVTPSLSGSTSGPASAGQAATIRRAQSSSPIAYDQQDTPRLWIVNPDQDSVSVMDPVNRSLLKEIPVGKAPRTLAVDNAGHVWVSNRGSGSISIIDPDTLEIASTIELSSAAQPYGVVNAPDGSGVWVSLLGSEELLQFDPVSRALKQRLWVGPEVRHLAIDASATQLLASRFISPPLPGENTITPTIKGAGVRGGEVMLIDPLKATIRQTVSLGVSEVPDTVISGRGLPNYLGAAAFSPDGQTAWIPSKQDNILRGQMRDNKQLDYQNTVRAIISRIDLKGGSATENLGARFDLDDSSLSSAAAYTPDGKYILVVLETSRELSLMDAASGTEIRRLLVGHAPQGVAISADGKQAVVSNFMTRSVSFLDISPLASDNPAQVTVSKQVRAFTSPDKLPSEVLLGKQMFYDARDTRLARDLYMSCASCHNDGYGDGRVWDMSGFGEGLRKTISLRGHGNKKKRLHWSGNFDEVQDFEQQIRTMSGGAGLMEPGHFFRGNYAAPLGTPKAGLSDDLDALAAYVNSLENYAPSPFRSASRDLSPAARTGEALFQARDCQSCHLSVDFGGDGTRREDIGTLKASSGKVQDEPLDGIIAPGLRDAWYNAPYLHDGSAPTLEVAIKAHNNLSLSDEEVNNLASYVREIGNDK